MADTIDSARRSENMRRIKSGETKGEIAVRRLIHGLGFRFRTHARELPGKPDVVRRRHRQAIFVHGCFWHQHANAGCADARLPKSNRLYWLPKLRRTRARDKAALAALADMGWSTLVIWECETADFKHLERKLRRFLGSRACRKQ